jgi:hypothetical protein
MIYCRLLLTVAMVYTTAYCSPTQRHASPATQTQSAPPVSECNTGNQLCCNSLQHPNSPEVFSLAQSLGLSLLDKAMVGIDCTCLFSILT